MKTIKDVFRDFKQSLTPLYDERETEAVTLMVINEVTGLSRAKIKAFPEQELTDTEKLQLILKELKSGKPVQYILGHTEFYGLDFLVNPAVLIPRPETEELVEWILKSQPAANANIIDIGTGSGCIAISLKKNLPFAQVSALDISEQALQTAKKNAIINETAVNFIHADILDPQPEFEQTRFDIVVSNPPYVTLLDKMLMHQNVNDFEPHTALFVPDSDPLLFYRAIADVAMRTLTDQGMLFLEINESFGEQTVELLSQKGFSHIELRKDMSGRDRMIKAKK
ncbi:peptide chain release factor N(5)-glutamine methyltransferase [Mucilaginibacter segetis]|uniref:Release factor glutamine methyltransferase n=1 Tax=Mucilaginibacter segetis TaxID=2793071 RepID=A0A934PSU7_9SPHI|nr:peptide chain release factor N(5)-glutamine methyltransferase [Mucilaginibacter segetis]MBK0378882.1 peptide chain release factor N(5)-glutamine methyltransferase [Mucilaginibacter segetis]